VSGDPARQRRIAGPGAARLSAPENWRAAAACRSADPDLFFLVSDFGMALEQVAEAKAICAGCSVRRECLAFALRTHQIHGIWGGMTEAECYLRRGLISREYPPMPTGRHTPGRGIRNRLQPVDLPTDQ
jgi:WhiB family redox-sensing transcriptional regulator